MSPIHAQRNPLQFLPALALVLAAGLDLAPRAGAQEPAPGTQQPAPDAQAIDDAAPPKLPPWSWDCTPAHLRIAAALREARHASPGSEAGLLQRIVESGRDAVAAQVDILLRGRVPETSPKDAPQVLSDVQRELLLSALAKMPQKAVRKELDERLAKSPDDARARLGAMLALGTIGEATDLAQLIALAPRKPDSPELALTRSGRETLRDTLATLLRRVPQAWSALSAELRRTDLSASKVLLDGLASERDPRALALLLEAARTNPKLAWKAASLMPACGSSLNAQTDRECLEWLRGELATAEPDYARTLLMAVGTLDDGEFCPELIDRLEDENSGIREEALSALRHISGLGFPGVAAAWRAWYATEARWHAEQRPKLQAQLSSAETTKVVSALREYSEHRTRRGELASEVAKLLEHPKADVRSLAISVLEHLGSPVACAALVGMLGDSDSKVGEAAWHALSTISGVALSRDPEQLHALFGSS